MPELVLLRTAGFDRWCRHDAFRQMVFAVFAERLTDLMALVEAVSFQRLDQRLAQALLGHGPALHTTHQGLADELGTVREMVSRLLSRFERAGWVRLGRERIELPVATSAQHPTTRLALLERLYPVAKSRQDSALLSAVLKQLFALPASSGQLGLLQKLADDSQAADAKLLQHPAIQLHLLQGLLRAQEPARALGAWRKLSQGTQRPAQLPALTLALAKQLARQQPRALGELSAFLQQAYPATEQAAQIGLLRAPLS